MRRSSSMAASAVLALSLACGDTGGCGALDSEYEYPRTEPEAQVTPEAARVRITEAGFDTVAGGVPGIMRAACEANPPDGSESCAVDPGDPNRVQFYVSDSINPVEFEVLGNPGGLRAGSLIALELASLGNIDITLIDAPTGPDGIQVTIGCNAPDLALCTNPSEYALGSIDMVLWLDETTLLQNTPPLGWHDSACFIQDDNPPNAGIIIESFRFIMYPRMQLDADGRPYLRLEEDDVTVERLEVTLDVQIGEASWDPMCQASTDNCNLCGSADWILGNILEPVIESGTVARSLATVIAEAIFGQVADRPLDIEGQIRTQDLISVINDDASPTGYRIAANINSPSVTGPSGAQGFNFDFDSGFVSDHNDCVAELPPPSWVLPPAPDPGTTVVAPNPVTGDPTTEVFDLAVLVGDSFFDRALFELHDGGTFCLMLGADEVAELSGGAFSPSVGALELIAPGLVTLAPLDAPVDLWIVPRYRAAIGFGSGEGEGADRDSHLQLVWPNLGVEMYPLVDDTFLRAVAFSFDLDLGISFEPTPSGNMMIVIDRVDLVDVTEIYNEMNIAFSPSGFAEIISAFLPTLLSADPIDIDLTAETLGFPFVPKLRAAKALGTDDRYLGMFFRFCTPDDIEDSGDALCYEDPSGGSDIAAGLGVVRVEGPGGELPHDTMRVRAFSEVERLEIAYRVDGAGPYFAFRNADDDGLFTIQHPLLAIGGAHEVTFLGRPHARPWQWTPVATVSVFADHAPPIVVGERVAGGVRVSARDDASARVEVRARVGERELGFASRDFVTASGEERVTLWARDEIGNLSEPFVVWPRGTSVIPTAELEPAAGCTAMPVGFWWLVPVLLLRRRR